jgi:hypothetical protein
MYILSPFPFLLTPLTTAIQSSTETAQPPNSSPSASSTTHPTPLSPSTPPSATLPRHSRPHPPSSLSPPLAGASRNPPNSPSTPTPASTSTPTSLMPGVSVPSHNASPRKNTSTRLSRVPLLKSKLSEMQVSKRCIVSQTWTTLRGRIHENRLWDMYLWY